MSPNLFPATAVGSVSRTAEEVKEVCCSAEYVFLTIRTVSLVLIYYCFSIGLTFFQKSLVQDFHFPLTIVLVHLIVKFLLASLARFILEWKSGESSVILPWSSYSKKVAIVGIASALDISLSNWSFEFISISLYTMTKSTSIIFILFFGIMLRLEKLRLSLIGVIFMIATGLFVFSYESSRFHFIGFMMALTGSFVSGLRWSCAQLIMQREKLGLDHPIDLIYHVQPWMTLTLIPFVIFIEGPAIAVHPEGFGSKSISFLFFHSGGRMLVGALLAFFMELSEFLLVSYTSSLTLSVAGIMKEMATFAIAFLWSSDEISGLKILGLVICMSGVTFHVILKALHSEELKTEPVISPGSHVGNLETPLLLNHDLKFPANGLGSLGSSDEDDELEAIAPIEKSIADLRTDIKQELSTSTVKEDVREEIGKTHVEQEQDMKLMFPYQIQFTSKISCMKNQDRRQNVVVIGIPESGRGVDTCYVTGSAVLSRSSMLASGMRTYPVPKLLDDFPEVWRIWKKFTIPYWGKFSIMGLWLLAFGGVITYTEVRQMKRLEEKIQNMNEEADNAIAANEISKEELAGIKNSFRASAYQYKDMFTFRFN
ncbi:unnamed protein product [Cyprideis torosa]|uniref:Uncharacterized protein n=1 Tax=Cyprideis torosa TaxID=163714 RepID=A0A7R8WFH3_9CRUS|nr:unnamed protein product [Cyprideis torosa]CAG0890941.1 unnamed protein product [Cyprideis torosa]